MTWPVTKRIKDTNLKPPMIGVRNYALKKRNKQRNGRQVWTSQMGLNHEQGSLLEKNPSPWKGYTRKHVTQKYKDLHCYPPKMSWHSCTDDWNLENKLGESWNFMAQLWTRPRTHRSLWSKQWALKDTWRELCLCQPCWPKLETHSATSLAPGSCEDSITG